MKVVFLKYNDGTGEHFRDIESVSHTPDESSLTLCKGDKSYIVVFLDNVKFYSISEVD